jgi:hypothetical protein
MSLRAENDEKTNSALGIASRPEQEKKNFQRKK